MFMCSVYASMYMCGSVHVHRTVCAVVYMCITLYMRDCTFTSLNVYVQCCMYMCDAVCTCATLYMYMCSDCICARKSNLSPVSLTAYILKPFCRRRFFFA